MLDICGYCVRACVRACVLARAHLHAIEIVVIYTTISLVRASAFRVRVRVRVIEMVRVLSLWCVFVCARV
jgi:hypothetical protein